MVAFDLEGGSRVIARPSGTEPKAKFYFDVCDRVGDGESAEVAESRARDRMNGSATAPVSPVNRTWQSMLLPPEG